MKKSSILRVDYNDMGFAMILALYGLLVGTFIAAKIGGYMESLQSYDMTRTNEDFWFIIGCSFVFLALGIAGAMIRRVIIHHKALRLWRSGERWQAIRLWRKLEGD